MMRKRVRPRRRRGFGMLPGVPRPPYSTNMANPSTATASGTCRTRCSKPSLVRVSATTMSIGGEVIGCAGPSIGEVETDGE